MFQDFIVLGIIPGTNFQISFQLWLLAVTSAIAGYLLWEYRAEVHMHLMLWRIRLAIAAHLLEVK